MFGPLYRKPKGKDVFFTDPLLEMGYAGRFFVRVVTSSSIVVQSVVTLMALFIEVSWVFWLGILSSLYLLDRLIHFARSDEQFPLAGPLTHNVALYLSPRARRAIVSAYNKAAVLGGGFYLNLARILSETAAVSEMLSRLDVDSVAFNSKLDAYLARDLVSYKDHDRLIGEAERLVFVAFENKTDEEKDLDYANLFAALGGIENEQLVSLFDVFEFGADDLRKVVPFGRLVGRAWVSRLAWQIRGLEAPPLSAFSCAILKIEQEHKVKIPYSSIIVAMNHGDGVSYQEKTSSALGLIRNAAIYASKKGDDIVRGEDVGRVE